jgi:hypothetical protein
VKRYEDQGHLGQRRHRGVHFSRAVEDYGRPVSFDYAGVPPAEDGSEVFLDTDMSNGSLNQRALEEGLASDETGIDAPRHRSIRLTCASCKFPRIAVYCEDERVRQVRLSSLRLAAATVVALPRSARLVTPFVFPGSRSAIRLAT